MIAYVLVGVLLGVVLFAVIVAVTELVLNSFGANRRACARRQNVDLGTSGDAQRSSSWPLRVTADQRNSERK